MKTLSIFDENLSEELLDENVSASRISISLKIDKNMRNNPLQNKGKRKDLPEPPSCSVRCIPTFSYSGKENTYDAIKSKNHSRCLSSAKLLEQRCTTKSKLQLDIKDLLHKAIEIRSTMNSPARPSTSHKNQLWRTVTMKDIPSAQ
ncbi:unnamed protein product [Moneuplotes crassus]|uniref:Uncharacterized protein n=1 Tax=Euplotes crassus TaxID=5936 RepID=A0AAD1UG40_EUPCR|nr:unnamed protein product [Moneuplotes crassus]